MESKPKANKQTCFHMLMYWSRLLQQLYDVSDDQENETSIDEIISSEGKSKIQLERWILQQVGEVLDTVDDITKLKTLNLNRVKTCNVFI